VTRLPSAEAQALAECLPLVRAERRWHLIDVLAVKSGLAIASWAFLSGGVTAELLGLWDGLAVMLLGNAIGVVLLTYAYMLPSVKWGTEFYAHMKSVFGARGVMVLVVGPLLLGAAGWGTILATMIGRAAVQMAELVGGGAVPGGPAAFSAAVALAALLCSWLVLRRGSSGVRLLNLAAAPMLIALCLFLLWAVFRGHSLAEVAALPPVHPRGDRATNIMLALELNVCVGLSWGNLAGNLGRYAVTARAAVWGSFIAYVPVNVLAAMVGLVAGLTLGSADPAAWMVPMFAPVLAALLLVVLSLANFSSLVGMMQGNTQSLIQHLGLLRLGWGRFVALLCVIFGVLVLVAGDEMQARFFTFAAFLQAVVAPLVGVVLADCWLLRRQRVDVAAMYVAPGTGPYGYWWGFNPAALIALIAGGVTYLSLFDPIALTGTPLFVVTGATLPAVVVAMAVHWGLTRAFVIPAGRGGYDAHTATVGSGQPSR
jgi:NCS1 family nucleobase:cation symporter-1